MTDVAPHWPVEFARVIACIHCTTSQCPKLLRDELENIPQGDSRAKQLQFSRGSGFEFWKI
jgi:hypothetical protein